VFASATICPMSSFATPRSPGREIDRALALASFSIEIGPYSPTAKIAAVMRSGASVSASHSSWLNADLAVMSRPPMSCQHWPRSEHRSADMCPAVRVCVVCLVGCVEELGDRVRNEVRGFPCEEVTAVLDAAEGDRGGLLESLSRLLWP